MNNALGIGALVGLRKMARSRAPQRESCELCSVEVSEPHAHLLETGRRRVLCACAACAMLFSNSGSGARFRRIPSEVRLLEDCGMTDTQWLSLGIPINLAFLGRPGEAQHISAMYPSPAGITESEVALDAWHEILQDEPRLASMQDGVQAFLVNRLSQPYQHYIAPIDSCYRLVGIICMHWKGFSGGTEVWKQIAAFFDDLRTVAGGDKHA